MIWFSFSKVFPDLVPFIKWCAKTSLGSYISHAAWAFKFIETVHILAWVVLLGTTLIVNLRLLGIVRGWSVEQIARSVAMYIHGSLSMVFVTGVLMFLSDPAKYYTNLAFGPKILFFSIAVLYQLTLYRRVVRSARRSIPMWSRLAGAFSLVLWFMIGAAGRAIGAI